MKQHFNNGQEYLMVEVPEDATLFEVREGYWGNDLLKYNDGKTGVSTFLPSDKWQILFLASEATEEQAGEVVGKIKGWPTDLYYNYTAGGRDFRDIVEAAFKNPIESLRSLLSSHGMEGETLFLKRVK